MIFLVKILFHLHHDFSPKVSMENGIWLLSYTYSFETHACKKCGGIHKSPIYLVRVFLFIRGKSTNADKKKTPVWRWEKRPKTEIAKNSEKKKKKRTNRRMRRKRKKNWKFTMIRLKENVHSYVQHGAERTRVQVPIWLSVCINYFHLFNIKWCEHSVYTYLSLNDLWWKEANGKMLVFFFHFFGVGGCL